MNSTSTFHNDMNLGSIDVPLFVRGVEGHGGGVGAGGDGYADDGSDMHELRECQRRLAEATARGKEATARCMSLENDLQGEARKRMALEKELNDVHREHSKQMAAKQQAHDQLRNDFEKLQHYNLKLREELLRTNRELIGVLAKRNEIRKEADRAARQNLRNEIRKEEQLQAADAAGLVLPADLDAISLAAAASSHVHGGGGGLVAFPGAPPPSSQQQQQQYWGRKSSSGVAAPPSMQDPAHPSYRGGSGGPQLQTAHPQPVHASNVNPLAAARHGPSVPHHHEGGDPSRPGRSSNAIRDLRDFFDM